MIANPKPFTMKYVLGVTIDHQILAVEKSLNKTLARSREPQIPAETSKEIFLTIQALINKRQQLLQERTAIE